MGIRSGITSGQLVSLKRLGGAANRAPLGGAPFRTFDAGRVAREEHLDAALQWLERAHDIAACEGISYGYVLGQGWRPTDREASGAVVDTFFTVADVFDEPRYAARARRVGRFLIAVQSEDGSFPSAGSGGRGAVSVTGHALAGLVAMAIHTSDERAFPAAERAADWLVSAADAQGLWTRTTHSTGVPCVSDAPTAWSLLALNRIRPDPARERVARACLDFAARRVSSLGFDERAFAAGGPPDTCSLGGAIRGLVEGAVLAEEPSWLSAAERASQGILPQLSTEGHLPGRIGVGGTARASHCSLTGNALLAAAWMRLADLTSDAHYADAARRALRYVMATQELDSQNDGTRGGIKGSQPVWGGYAPFSYPSSAAKCFVDALLLTGATSVAELDPEGEGGRAGVGFCVGRAVSADG